MKTILKPLEPKIAAPWVITVPASALLGAMMMFFLLRGMLMPVGLFCSAEARPENLPFPVLPLVNFILALTYAICVVVAPLKIPIKPQCRQNRE